jgi:hypothetical protein
VSLRWLLSTALLLALLPTHAQQSAPVPIQTQESSHSKPVAKEVQVQCLPASRASELMDKHGCIAGRVFRVTSSKSGNTRIALCPNRNACKFHAVVFSRDRDNFGDLGYLHGRAIAILGDITEYRGGPQIVITSREQIKVVAVNPPPEFDAAKGTPSGKSNFDRPHTRAW